MLVVFGGLPGVGKTTIARQVARTIDATYLRIDTIEQALRSSNVLAADVGPAGYIVAYGLAEANLRLNRIVVADCVNPLDITRDAWTSVASDVSCPIMQIELVCSDVAEHRRRVETRSVDIAGLVLPTWDIVCNRAYQPFVTASLRIDTAATSARDAASLIISEIELRRHGKN